MIVNKRRILRWAHSMIHGSPVGFYFSAQGSGPDISVFSAVLFSMLLISGVWKSSTWTFQLHVIVFLRLAPEPTALVIDCLFMTIQDLSFHPFNRWLASNYFDCGWRACTAKELFEVVARTVSALAIGCKDSTVVNFPHRATFSFRIRKAQEVEFSFTGSADQSVFISRRCTLAHSTFDVKCYRRLEQISS